MSASLRPPRGTVFTPAYVGQAGSPGPPLGEMGWPRLRCHEQIPRCSFQDRSFFVCVMCDTMRCRVVLLHDRALHIPTRNIINIHQPPLHTADKVQQYLRDRRLRHERQRRLKAIRAMVSPLRHSTCLSPSLQTTVLCSIKTAVTTVVCMSVLRRSPRGAHRISPHDRRRRGRARKCSSTTPSSSSPSSAPGALIASTSSSVPSSVKNSYLLLLLLLPFLHLENCFVCSVHAVSWCGCPRSS